jgi:hypothetical protein
MSEKVERDQNLLVLKKNENNLSESASKYASSRFASSTREQISEIIELNFLKLRSENNEGYNISIIKAFKWLCMDGTLEKYKKNSRYRSEYHRDILNHNQDIKYRMREASSESDDSTHFHYIMRVESKFRSKSVKIPYFSDNGFKIFCCIAKSEIKQLVLEYFVEVESKFWKALFSSEQENKAKADYYLRKFQMMEEKNKILCEDIDGLKECRDILSNELNSTIEMNAKYSIILDSYTNIEEMDETSLDSIMNPYKTYDGLCPKLRQINELMVKLLFRKTVSVYVINPDYILELISSSILKSRKRSKNIDMEDQSIILHREKNIYKYEEEMLNHLINNYKDEDDNNKFDFIIPQDITHYRTTDNFYFFITPLSSLKSYPTYNYKKITELHFGDKRHYGYFTKNIKKNAFKKPRSKTQSSSLSNTYDISWEEITLQKRISDHKYLLEKVENK